LKSHTVDFPCSLWPECGSISIPAANARWRGPNTPAHARGFGRAVRQPAGACWCPWPNTNANAIFTVAQPVRTAGGQTVGNGRGANHDLCSAVTANSPPPDSPIRMVGVADVCARDRDSGPSSNTGRRLSSTHRYRCQRSDHGWRVFFLNQPRDATLVDTGFLSRRNFFWRCSGRSAWGTAEYSPS